MTAAESREPSLRQRLDPNDSLTQAEGLTQILRNPIVRRLLELSESTHKHIDDLEAAAARMSLVIGGLDDTAQLLGPLGWCTIGRMPSDVYREATELVRAGDPEAAEVLITDGWNAGRRLHDVRNTIKTIYGPDDPRRVHRWRAIDEALRCHDEGLYRGSISIVLPLIEGVIDDVSERDPDVRFYRRGTADLLTDGTTLAGHSSSLPALSRILGAQQKETGATGVLRRNGILHGKELDYGSRRNSTKAIVALMAAIEWAQPIARRLIEEALEERALRHAGSDACDEHGRRLDRREFDPVKKVLHTVAAYQFGRRKRGLDYASEINELGIRDELAGDPRWVLRADGASDSYHCWFVTVPGWVLGIAGRNSEYPVWLFSDGSEPVGGIDVDSRWAHVVGDPAPLDW